MITSSLVISIISCVQKLDFVALLGTKKKKQMMQCVKIVKRSSFFLVISQREEIDMPKKCLSSPFW